MTGPMIDLARCLASEHDARTAVRLWLATATDADLAVFAATVTEQASTPGFRMPLPTQVRCPTCHEPPGEECRTWRDGVTTAHWPRWHAAIDAAAYSQAISTGNGGAAISAASNAADAPHRTRRPMT